MTLQIKKVTDRIEEVRANLAAFDMQCAILMSGVLLPGASALGPCQVRAGSTRLPISVPVMAYSVPVMA